MSTQTVAILRNVGGLVFDATLKEGHQLEIDVTENPIETGSSVADNMYVKVPKITVTAGVGNTLLHNLLNDPFSGSNRAQAAFDALTALQVSGEPFAVQTGLRFYPTMMCKSIRAEQDKDTDAVLFFEADFVGVNIVGTETVSYTPRAAGATSRQAAKTKNKGEQQGTQVPDSKKGSLLARLKHLMFDK